MIYARTQIMILKRIVLKRKDSRNVFYLVHLVLYKPIIFPSGETGLNVFFEQLDT